MSMSQKIDLTEALPSDALQSVVLPSTVLRLLNGALRGGEFVLEAGTTLFVASRPGAFQHGAGQPAFPDNAIFIPVDEGGGNFEIEVSVQEDGTQSIAIRDLSDAAGNGDATPYSVNTVHRIAGLDIALRAQDETWSEQVRNYGAAAVAPPTQAAIAPKQKPQSQQQLPSSQQRGKTLRLAGLALLGTLLAGVAATLFWTQFTQQRSVDNSAAEQKTRLSQAAQLSMSLRGAGQFRVLPGRDGLMYVFAANERDAAWARQSVTRGNEVERIRVLRKSEEIARIERLLDGMAPAPAYHTVRLADPALPEIWLSRERAPLTTAACRELAQQLKTLLPYAEQVQIHFVADAAVAEQAEAGLERLGVQHKRTDNGGSVTMSIRGALADGDLQKIRSYVETFYRQWGTQYVHYSVEMADDLRKGKSFEYGGEGYLKPAASHWDFSVQS
jgi:type III secretion system PrgH/EprH family protein